MKKLVFIINVDWFFVSHRLPIAEAAQKNGYEVHIICTITDHQQYLESLGFTVHNITFDRSGRSILKEIQTFLSLRKILRKISPDVIHAVTIKPVLYSGILARLLKIKASVFAISGLGTVFISKGLTARIRRGFVSLLYKAALTSKNCVIIFQNTSDRETLSKIFKIDAEKSILIKGSGVDLNRYIHLPEPKTIPIITMASRLLVEKGVFEFVEAAKSLTKKGIKATFWLIGTPDYGNPGSVTEKDIALWKTQNYVKILGYQQNIPDLFSKSHIIVLPSYYGEGIPKVLIEAAACGRPVVTTDNPGCAEAIIPGVTGLVVPTRNSNALHQAIEHLINDPLKRQNFGIKGRQFAEQTYDINHVIQQHLDIYETLGRT